MDIFEIIKEKKSGLTRKQRMIADYMLQNPDKLAYITLKDLSKATGVTEITILNTCQSLGYDGFNDVKYEFRKANIIQQKTDVFEEREYYTSTVPMYERSNKAKILEEIGNEELKMITGFWSHINMDAIFKFARILEESRRIFICGRGVSYFLGEFLSKRLTSCDIFSVCVNTELNDDAYGAMGCIDKDSLILAISFPDYYFMTEKFAEFAKEKGATVLAITDKKEAEITKIADFALLVPSMTRTFLNTMSAAMFLVNILTSAICLDAKEDNEGAEEKKII